MRFALHGGARVEAEPGAEGRCPGCDAPLTARCGTQNVHHWAHRGRRHCDPWWENETDWHRSWKAFFPLEWQEVSARDAQGELHIADIRTPDGRVVEFQHSAIAPAEVEARTRFHDRVVWVIDGLRRQTDHWQVGNALRDASITRAEGAMVYEFHYLEFTRLLRDWAGLKRPVVLDFGNRALFGRGPYDDDSDDLLVLDAVRHRGNTLLSAFGFFLPRDDFVRRIKDGADLPAIRFDVTRPKRRNEEPWHYPVAVDFG